MIMTVCCDQESNLLFCCRSHLAIRAGCGGGGLLGVCWSCLWRSSSLFFPMQRSQTPPRRHRQRGEKKMNGEEEQSPTLRGRPATFTHVIFSNNEGNPLGGQPSTAAAHSHDAQYVAASTTRRVSFPPRWRVITYILPQDPNLQLLSYLHKFGSTGWI